MIWATVLGIAVVVVGWFAIMWVTFEQALDDMSDDE